MKVLFVTRKWPPAVGGMEVYSKELVDAMSRLDGVELEVFALEGDKNGHAPGLLKIGFFFLRATLFLWRHGSRFDVVHFGDFVLFPLASLHRWLFPKRARCMTVYGLDLTYGRKRGILPAVYRRFVRFAVKQAKTIDRYIAISRFTGRLALDVGLRDVSVVPLGINLQSVGTISEVESAGVRQPFVLYLGRVVRRKGAFWFANEVLPRFHGELKFVVAGRFYSESDRRYLSELPDVEVLGQVSAARARQLRRDATAIVMPNIPIANSADVEGFGLTAVEAPAAGSVLLASRLEGIEDAVMDGVTGFLVEPGNADAWESALRRVLGWSRSTKDEFIAQARAALEHHYRWETVAKRTVDEYRKCLAK